jgi:glycosyltransferase involved in cell wall biosynthesis
MSKPIKILYIIDSYANPNAGTEGQLFQLIKNLDRKLFTPKLLVFTASEWLKKNEFPCPVEILGHSSIKSPFTWFSLIKKAKQYKDEGFKIAHIYFNDASVICPPVFYCYGIKTFISRRDMGYWYNALYRMILPITGKFVTKVLVNSKAVGEITSKVEKISNEKIAVIYNGYDVNTEETSVIKQLHDFKGDSILLGIVANIRPIKRMQDAIQALAALQSLNVKLVIIGGGDSSELSTLAQKINIEDKVLFLGARDDVKDCLQYVDIGLLCSESEGFSNAIVEYQFVGLPVVCSRVGGNPEAVTDGKNGYLFEAGNIKELQKKVALLLNSNELRELMAIEAKKTANNSYSINTLISKHQSLYQESLGVNK